MLMKLGTVDAMACPVVVHYHVTVLRTVFYEGLQGKIYAAEHMNVPAISPADRSRILRCGTLAFLSSPLKDDPPHRTRALPEAGMLIGFHRSIPMRSR
jgi:hypothetical protein